MKQAPICIAGTCVALAGLIVAQDVTPGVPGDAAAQGTELFPLAVPLGITVTGTTILNGETSVCPAGDISVNDAFGIGRGFESINAFVIANGHVEDLDDDGGSAGSPFGCHNAAGVGNPGFGSDCAGSDPDLFASVGVNHSDATVYSISFDAATPTVLELSYNFVTHENPSDPLFGDAFGIFYDGALVAGGTTNGGPTPGTDPWTFLPSAVNPFEFQSIPATGLHQIPANETRRRTLTLPVGPGSHDLKLVVADGGPGGTPCPNGTMVNADRSVHTALYAGVALYWTGNPGSVSPVQMDHIGHVAVAGGPFGDDLQIRAQGVVPGSIVLLIQAGITGVPFTIPLLAPHEVLVNIIPVIGIASVQVAGAGPVLHPPGGPIAVPAMLAGEDFFVQWWGLVPCVGVFNSKAYRLQF